MDQVPVTQPIELDRLAVGRSLGIEDIQDMERHQNRIDKIIDWAKMKGATSQDDYVIELNHLRNKIGSPTIFDLSVYINLEMEHLQEEAALKDLQAKHDAREGKLKKFEKRDDKGRFL